MSVIKQMWDYYKVRFEASRERDLERGEVSATTIVMAAALVGLVPTQSRASIIFNYGLCNPSDGCTQSVNFSPANSGATFDDDDIPF